MMPNRDRVVLPLAGSYNVTSTFAAGIGTGYKAALDDIGGTSELALGLFVTYAYSAGVSFGSSWVHGKLVAGEASLPNGTSGVDFRALHVWVSVTR